MITKPLAVAEEVADVMSAFRALASAHMFTILHQRRLPRIEALLDAIVTHAYTRTSVVARLLLVCDKFKLQSFKSFKLELARPGRGRDTPRAPSS